MARKPILAANWKMNMLRAEAGSFCDRLRRLSEEDGGQGSADRASAGHVEVLVFPSFPLLDTVASGLSGGIAAVGGQDVHPNASGAHTGDVSAAQLVDAGCSWVLCGHSERRRDHGESDAWVGRKVKAAQEAGLIPLICVGETREERSEGRTLEVLERQVSAALAAALAAALDGASASFELAYEPVWAIGTGETATPEMAQEAHAFLRRLLGDMLGAERAAEVRILYGGSAKPENVDQLYAENDIDGFLVGGASLDSEKFSAMMRSCARSAP